MRVSYRFALCSIPMNAMLNKFRAVVFRGDAPETATLLSLLAVVVGVGGFLTLASEMLEGETQAFDVWAVRSLRQPGNPALPVGPAWLPEIARDITAVSGQSGHPPTTLPDPADDRSTIPHALLSAMRIAPKTMKAPPSH